MATGIYQNDDEETFTVTFPAHDILTTVTSSASVAANWIATTRQLNQQRLDQLIVGLDLEWRPTFQRGADANFTALIQLCVDQRCLIFQIIHADVIPDELSEFLSDERFRFVGVGIDADVAKLEEDYELTVANPVDLRVLAAEKMDRPELSTAGLATLVKEIMGLHMSKPRHIRASEWDRERLTLHQIKYACADAFASFEIGRRLFYDEI
ncbi:hypothetical protein LUZ62_055616 [Rhynchospora pubera]|uniref:3'-5' exonuclease domain-containing protein n=1 Tax=Rhynchospora pubera TaxID=906938 RepID=A0AAV8DTW9_9POAL|nr:hypothetical protein LUZ62_055616 [Rhynchospora pubera]